MCAVLVINVTTLFPLQISLIVFYAIMMITITGLLMSPNYRFRLSEQDISCTTIANLPGMFLSMDLLLEYWNEHVTTTLLCVKFAFSTGISYSRVNSSPPCATYICVSGHIYMCQWTGCCLAPNHYQKQCLIIINWTPGNKFQWNLNQSFIIYIQENAFQNVVCQNGGHFVQGEMS